MKTAVGAFAYVYIHRHRCAPSSEGGTLCAIIYIPVRRRHLLLLFLVPWVHARFLKGKGNASDRFPTPSFLIANQLSYSLSCDEAGLESK